MYEAIYEKMMSEGEPLPFALPEWVACAPFEEFCGMKIEEVSNGRAVLTMPFRAKLAQGKGLMHGGALTALADTAVAMAIKSVLPAGTHFATMELTLAFHAPVKGGTVQAVARVVRQEGRTLVGEAEIMDENGNRVASFTSLFRVKRQS